MTTMADDRGTLRDLVAGLVPFDEREAADRADVLAWIDAGADRYRLGPPAEPPKHLVTYFLPHDQQTDSVFLVDHRKAQRLLPPGVHLASLLRAIGQAGQMGGVGCRASRPDAKPRAVAVMIV